MILRSSNVKQKLYAYVLYGYFHRLAVAYLGKVSGASRETSEVKVRFKTPISG